MNYGMYTYAWDLAEEGIDTVTGRLADAGINTITMATSYHAGRFLRPHAPQRKVYRPEDGTIYFQPDLSRYGPIKPRVNSMVETFDALRLLERHRPDMRRVGWTVCLHNSALGHAHPELVARNPFGDPLSFNLCPSKGHVADYLTALCADLSNNYDLASLALETPGWLPHAHGEHHEFSLTLLDEPTETLMGLCFCDDCKTGARQAGIDADNLQAKARDRIENLFQEEEKPPSRGAGDGGLAVLSADPEMAAFLNWRCQLVANLVARIRETMNAQVALGVVPTIQTPNALSWREGSDLQLLAKSADFLEVPAYQTGVDAIEADIQAVRRQVGAETPLNFILRPSPPNLFSADDVVGAVQALSRAGMQDVAFYNYGHVRLSALDWIKDALASLD